MARKSQKHSSLSPHPCAEKSNTGVAGTVATYLISMTEVISISELEPPHPRNVAGRLGERVSGSQCSSYPQFRDNHRCPNGVYCSVHHCPALHESAESKIFLKVN
jgi:hypothetical protein